MDEIEHRLKLGQIGLDAHIDLSEFDRKNSKPIWMIDRLAQCGDTPEARMMEHLRSNHTPWIALMGLFAIVLGGLLQQRGWLSIRETGVGWAPITFPKIVGGLLGRIGSVIWIGCTGWEMVYCTTFCAQRVERIVWLSHSLMYHLSIVLLGSAIAVWALESGTVIGASTLVLDCGQCK